MREPAAFLMDEPLSNLDAALRVQTRAEILKLQKRLATTTIYVTHDQVEAMTMGDRIAVMKKGMLQQIGTPEELYTPARERLRRDVHRLAVDERPPGPGDRYRRRRRTSPASAPSTSASASASPARSFEATIEVVEYLGDEQLVHLGLGSARSWRSSRSSSRLEAGTTASFAVAHESVLFFAADSGQATESRS